MVVADDIFGGLVALDYGTSGPGQDWATMPPFECTEEPIERATDLSANTSNETCTTRRSAEARGKRT